METLELNQTRFSVLDEKLENTWNGILEKSKMVKEINNGTIDIRLYAIYMFETYHYTFHNAKNQAMVGVKAENIAPQYLKYCFEHAEEETGHELMALHDVKSLGLQKLNFTIPDPLPATETLIAYLYWVSSTGSVTRRLGYSYWAENAYHYIMPLIEKVKDKFNLQNNQLTFFMAHSDIDTEHFEEVKEMINKFCKTDDDWTQLTKVMETSLKLTAEILEASYHEFQNLLKGNSKYEFLNVLVKS